ncbi:hypothetical protein GCM10009775_04180 [Microbacterium aoyamense]|uniref:Uncharacterized protein n=1 Tax=Microbacterium aoyamense TaxID=344166 RepID=A0ABN2PAN5_9MICO|nr:hypothetical protein [Microbacterium aoyamense]
MDDDELAEAVYNLPDHERQVVQEMHSRVEQVVALPAVIFDDAQPMLIRQSCLDAFYIHVRMLAEFFSPLPKKPRPDDRNAVHFTTRNPWQPQQSALDRLLTVARDVNKQIAHVTTTRIGNGAEEPATVLLLDPHSAAEVTDAVRQLWDDLVTHTDVPWPRVGLFPVWTDEAGNLRVRLR